MEIRMFDLKNAPAMQGLAIAEIIRKVGGRAIEAGEIVPTHAEKQQGNMLYVRLQKGSDIFKAVETLWWDDGCALFCHAFKFPLEDWQLTNTTGTYFADPLAWIN